MIKIYKCNKNWKIANMGDFILVEEIFPENFKEFLNNSNNNLFTHSGDDELIKQILK
jgi:hypothetical protein